MTSQLEDLFAMQLDAAGLGGYVREAQIIPNRKFRYDFYFPEHRLCVEVQGGVWSNGAHSRPTGIKRDYEKSNLCTQYGFKLLQFDVKAVKSGEALDVTEQLINQKQEQ